MDALYQALSTGLSQFDWRSAIEIVVIAVALYWLMSLIQGTTAMMLVRGIVVLLLLGTMLGVVLNLTVLNWVLRNSIPALIVALPILFQPELRRMLEQVGRAGGWLPHASSGNSLAHAIETIATTARRLSERRWGALIVLERETGLAEYTDSGVTIDALASVELLLNLFYPNSPLHDGAVIIRGGRVAAAGCVLPLSDIQGAAVHYGTRHRAALGITERTDAITVVVSEETGRISVGRGGQLIPDLDEAALRRELGAGGRPGRGDNVPGWLRGRAAARAG